MTLIERLRLWGFGENDSPDGIALRLINEAADEIERLQAWQPIETAPQDGSLILGWVAHTKGLEGMPAVICWRDYYFGLAWGDEFGNENPTHWMPIPPPPTNEQRG